MKIEIELQEVEALRRQINELEVANDILKGKLKDLDESDLKDKAIRLSYRLLDNYLAAVFEGLGFTQKYNDSTVIVKSDLERYLGKNWWDNKDRIKFELGAEITTEFKRAFLKIGVMPEEKIKETEDDIFALI